METPGPFQCVAESEGNGGHQMDQVAFSVLCWKYSTVKTLEMNIPAVTQAPDIATEVLVRTFCDLKPLLGGGPLSEPATLLLYARTAWRFLCTCP